MYSHVRLYSHETFVIHAYYTILALHYISESVMTLHVHLLVRWSVCLSVLISSKSGKLHLLSEHSMFRLKYGFSEFNSDTYGPIAFKAVVALVGCAQDQEVKDLANVVMNLQVINSVIF